MEIFSYSIKPLREERNILPGVGFINEDVKGLGPDYIIPGSWPEFTLPRTYLISLTVQAGAPSFYVNSGDHLNWLDSFLSFPFLIDRLFISSALFAYRQLAP